MDVIEVLMQRYGYDRETAEQIVILYKVEQKLEDLLDLIDAVREYESYV